MTSIKRLLKKKQRKFKKLGKKYKQVLAEGGCPYEIARKGLEILLLVKKKELEEEK